MPAAIIEPRHVDTNLTYFGGPDKAVAIDFTQPDSETRFGSVEKLTEHCDVKIQDARGVEDKFSLDTNGFVYVKHKIDGFESCTTEEEYKNLIIPATEQLVKDVLGAHKVVTFTSRIRNLSEDPSKRADNRAPALSVHSDFSPVGALRALETTIPDAAEREALSRGRVVFMNVWRPLKTIKCDPLTVCDWASVDPEADMVPLRFQFPHGWNELAKWRRAERHQWYYLSGQTPEEPLMFMQFDSKAGKGGLTVPHSAFVDREWADAEARESIEIKIAAFVE
ncbi:hypothetical protein K438DRAFT_1921484 [Mycena galopus ATCC 62051]|nr:hypothetical protein K438DRAFT_1921484 [Mycena galopus ATCC 62051]